MSKQHTPEPWQVAEESFDNGGIHESVIRGLDGRAAIAVTLEFGPNNPAMREANARRIVAAVNACAGIPTELLEDSKCWAEAGIETATSLRKQLDELREQVECSTITRDNMEGRLNIATVKLASMKQQRDELLALLVRIDAAGIFGTKALEDIAAAVASMKGGA